MVSVSNDVLVEKARVSSVDTVGGLVMFIMKFEFLRKDWVAEMMR